MGTVVASIASGQKSAITSHAHQSLNCNKKEEAQKGTVSFSEKAITHIMFDMDGLLLDTERSYTIVQERILSRYGKRFEMSLKSKLMGLKATEAAQIFVQETGLDGILSPEEFLKEREEMLQSLFLNCELMPGPAKCHRALSCHGTEIIVASAKCMLLQLFTVNQRVSRLISHLHTHGVPMCVATSSHRRHFELKTTKHKEKISMMHHVVCGDDPGIKQGKPSPDIFLLAAQKFKGAPIDQDRILVFEDAPSGVAAAKNAGMWVVMVPDPNLDTSLYKGADQVLTSLLEFKPSDWGLPPFRDSLISKY
ncbi:(DL)-glycerol-3-phosphatase 2 isoform X2 [Amborella trichopoda]|nr:(DL)-glycerol-3-phosphatase 2 isoform X2 [Amborella trichopoda]XP_020518890.1 (DL)-glycerol-3-phosphatase 2 isoform X2 [Amborella trichopoda]|eukprot:XP_020518889.1 (DL)-glycerol-3-phosphatase 2 isoform X2 [Amborella trichopoda]